MFIISRYALSLFLIFVFSECAAFAETISTSDKEWHFGEFVIENKLVSARAIGSNFSNNTSLVIALVDAEKTNPKIMIAVGIKDAKFQDGKMHDLKLSFDYKPFPPLRLSPLNENWIATTIPATKILLQKIGETRYLSLSSEDKGVVYDLEGLQDYMDVFLQ
jgi:hypothetical protein